MDCAKAKEKEQKENKKAEELEFVGMVISHKITINRNGTYGAVVVFVGSWIDAFGAVAEVAAWVCRRRRPRPCPNERFD